MNAWEWQSETQRTLVRMLNETEERIITARKTLMERPHIERRMAYDPLKMLRDNLEFALESVMSIGDLHDVNPNPPAE